MSLFSKQEENIVLQNTLENLEAVRESNEILADVLKQFLNHNNQQQETPMSDEEKLKAAYALNLCTVSVSQIIDYNDVNFLEHEYEAILNNLNLEEMPKDEALLHILKQLLDVITYFRIQEGEKMLLEKEYQQKMKNAIWHAVPNIGLIVAGGNPVTMAISLASQVGIGYMNYRKEKAKIGLEQERKEWELQRSAMEQFNGLRRELFDTAWRLAEKYQFPDEYRLTERQITQYNRILMDTDDLRKYERLKYIRGKFKAYPPFWYYLGNSANSVSQRTNTLGADICADYKKKAIDAFLKFLECTERNLLREDQLKASCALELFDIWDSASEENQNKLRSILGITDDSGEDERMILLDNAQKASGNSFDVLQLCALSYLKIGVTDKAAELFRMLVNEGYNTIVNAQLLSKIYVMKALEDKFPNSQSRKEYKILQERVGAEHLFPMPTPEAISSEPANQFFIELQRQNLRKKYVAALSEFVSLYASRYDLLCARDGNISAAMIELLENMCSAVRRIVPGNSQFMETVQGAVHKKRYEIQSMLACDRIGAERPRTVEFNQLTKSAFIELAQTIRKNIDACNSMLLISSMEAEVDKFCIENKLHISSGGYGHSIVAKEDHSFAFAIFSDKYQEIQDRQIKVEEGVQIIDEIIKETPLVQEEASTKFHLKGSRSFDVYLNDINSVLNSHHIDSRLIVAIISSKQGIFNQDLLICIDGIRLLKQNRYCGQLPNLEVRQFSKHDQISFAKGNYKNDLVDLDALSKLTDSFAKMYNEQSTSDLDNATIIKNISDTINSAEITPTTLVNDPAYFDIQSCVLIEEIKRLPSNDRLVRIEGKVIKRNPTRGSFCKLVGEDSVYRIKFIGTFGNHTECKEGHITKFTLEKI